MDSIKEQIYQLYGSLFNFTISYLVRNRSSHGQNANSVYLVGHLPVLWNPHISLYRSKLFVIMEHLSVLQRPNAYWSFFE